MQYLRQVSRLLWSINVALAVAVVAAAVTLVVPRHPVSSTSVPAKTEDQSPASARVAARPGSQVDQKLILERDIFTTGSRKPPEPPAGRAPETVAAKGEGRRELAFRLVGTVAADAGASYAVLECLDRKTQDLYRVGDRIAGARIDSIEPSRVVVVEGGVREVLELAVTAAGPVSAPAPTVAQNPPVERAKDDSLVKVVSDSQREINTRASRSSVNQATQFLSKVKLSPNVVSGESDGLRLSGLGDSPMAQLVGLRDGDVVHTVNGHPVPNRRKAAQVLEKAWSLGKAQLEFTRGAEKKSLTFHTGSR